MKDIKNYITESSKGWEYLESITDTTGINLPGLDNKAAKWLLINTETETISAVTEKDLDSFKDDFGDDVTGPKVKKLKIGESFDADGGINIYIRIK